MLPLPKLIESEIRDVQDRIATLKEDFARVIADTELPLEERWDLFVKAPDFLKEHKGWVEDDGKPVGRVNIEHYFFTSDEMSDLRKTHELSRAIEDMQREMDSLLEPKAKKVMKLKDHLEVEELLKLFPPGFYRAELRTWYEILKRVNEV